MTSSEIWGDEIARDYDADSADMFADSVLGPTVDFLAALARRPSGGPDPQPGWALEFAIGTGRVALPLLARGTPVAGIELSEAMLRQLRGKADEAELPVRHGSMAETEVDLGLPGARPGEFSLVYLVFNTIMNLLTQDEQVECFRNAAHHLRPGGHFVIECMVPDLRRLQPGQTAVPFEVTDQHLGFDTYDLATQLATSHHFRPLPDGHYRRLAGSFRYVWPAELDLMARLAGLDRVERVADWVRTPFTGESRSHISVWRRS